MSTGAITSTEYIQWAGPNGQPAYDTAAGTALFAQINALMNSAKTNGVLPVNFYSLQLPKNFWGTPASNFDLTTLQGIKLFRLRNSLNTAFGDLYNYGQPRYIQFGLKLYF